MDDQTKICPECNAEYYAHITECRSCEVPLIFPHEKVDSRVPKGEGALICIEEGTYERITELVQALQKEGFDAKVLRAPSNSCGGGEYGAFVAQNIAREAAKKADELWQKMFPELIDAEEKLKQGLCPACGASLMGSSDECPDCGLFVGDPDNCGGDGSCGSCH